MNETHFTEKDRGTLITLEVKLDRAITDIASLSNNFANKSELLEVERRIDELEGNQKWLVRTIIAIIVASVIGLLASVK